jgi:multimeric flavodoxin WrbA/putative sterol carrier protein
MKILAINGSPRGARGNTDVLVQAFLSGARDAGAETDTVYVADLEIRHCTGCFSCWTRTPGVCVHDDDMPELLMRVRRSNVAVLASPLYGNMVTGMMKACLDRMLPLSHPAMVKAGDQHGHPARYDDGTFRIVVISNAGFPEPSQFDGLKATFGQLDRGPRSRLAGMICCAAGPMLTIPGMQDRVQWYLDATVRAGREVVERGRISEEMQTVLGRSLAGDPGEYANAVNAYWQSLGVDMPGEDDVRLVDIEHQGTPIEPAEDAGTVRNLVSRMPGSFSSEAAGDLRAVLQFDIADEEPGRYFLTMEAGRCEAFEGVHPAPTATVHAAAQVWLDVCTGELDGAAAFMSGQYTVTGDVSLLMRFGGLFSGDSRTE